MKTSVFTPILLLLSNIGLGNGFTQSPRIDNKRIKYLIHNGLFPRDVSNIVAGSMSMARKKNPLICSDDFSFLDEIEALKPGKKTQRIKTFEAKTENQQKYIDLMREDEVDIVIAIGPAGTGKTLLACYAAVEALRLGKIKKIVITRPVVSVDEEIGYLPGSITSKMDPWTRPIFDALRETYSPKEIETMMADGIIEIVPLGFMRGRTFKNAWIIADEMQNSTPTQMLMLATRIGEGSKMVITGDLKQSDLAGPNGLHEFYEKLQSSSAPSSHLKSIVLETSDVQRSRAAKAVLAIYSDMNTRRPIDKDEKNDEKKGEKKMEATKLPTVADVAAVEESEEAREVRNIMETTVLSAILSHLNSEEEETPSSEQVKVEPPSDVEWVDLDNDAAMMPRRHLHGKYYRD